MKTTHEAHAKREKSVCSAFAPTQTHCKKLKIQSVDGDYEGKLPQNSCDRTHPATLRYTIAHLFINVYQRCSLTTPALLSHPSLISSILEIMTSPA